MSDPENVEIWHNPRCSKSRATLELIRERGIEPKVVHYLDDPPSRQRLERVLELLGMEPRELMRTGESAYRELGLDDETLGRDELLRAMCAHPILIQRPVVITSGHAALGRPPESVLRLLEDG